MSETVEDSARQVLDVVPLVMRAIRTEFRKQRSSDLSVPQFRSLKFTKNNEGTSLSEMACHIGLTLPSMSKLVDGLVDRGLLQREGHAEDRRRICLKITPKGQELLEIANQRTHAYLAAQLSGLSEKELGTISAAMTILEDIFVTDRQ